MGSSALFVGRRGNLKIAKTNNSFLFRIFFIQTVDPIIFIAFKAVNKLVLITIIVANKIRTNIITDGKKQVLRCVVIY